MKVLLVSLAFENRVSEDASANMSTVIIGKKLKSVFDFLTYSRETGFLFSYVEVFELIRIAPSDEITRVSKFDKSLSFG